MPGAVKENRGQFLLEKAENLQLRDWDEHSLTVEEYKNE